MIPKPEAPDGLIDYAVTDAAKGLLQNWNDARKDDPNFPVETMAQDIDEVIEALTRWKKAILASGA